MYYCRRRACGGSVGVGTGLEESRDILVLAQLRDKRGLARERVLALECCCPGARDKTAFRQSCGMAQAQFASPPPPLLLDSLYRHFSLADTDAQRKQARQRR